jgi:16S rRNA (guanine(966)-N(2))-methyltransferase RsmD
MRIVAGTLGGRRFTPPTNIPARPTTDLAREGLFNILNNLIDFEACVALELFGGTGGVSYELVSRGAKAVTLVEQDAGSVAFIKKTAADFRIAAALNVVRGDVFKFLEHNTRRYDLVFADPPYALGKLAQLPELMLACLEPEGIAVLEHDSRHGFDEHPAFLRKKSYGGTVFSFFQEGTETSEGSE